MSTTTPSIESVDATRAKLLVALERLRQALGPIHIGNSEQLPFGWQKAAKGRTVWRILEEIINQNLIKRHREFSIQSIAPSDSEVSVFDFVIKLEGDADEVYVNIKSSVSGSKSSKDDISKAVGLLDFYKNNPNKSLFIATFILNFSDDPLSVNITEVSVMPTAWLPDIYVNPSNNGNLQSAHYKKLSTAIKRTNKEFIAELEKAVEIARAKKANSTTH